MVKNMTMDNLDLEKLVNNLFRNMKKYLKVRKKIRKMLKNITTTLRNLTKIFMN